MSEAAPLNAINQEGNQRALAWRIYFDSVDRMQMLLEAKLKKTFGLSLPEFNILIALWESEHHMLRMGDLAGHVFVSRSRLTYLVNKLVQHQLLEKHPATTDGRGFVASMTSIGERMILRATTMYQQIVRSTLLDGMDDSQIDQLVYLLQIVDSNVRQLEREAL